MDQQFLSLLPEVGRQHVREIEDRIGSEVVVRPVEPGDGIPYVGFPAYSLTDIVDGRFVALVLLEGSQVDPHMLFHEVLHLHRYLVQSVSQLKAREPATERKINFVGALENDLEHLWIVPIELEHFPDAHSYWTKHQAEVTAEPIAQAVLLASLGRNDKKAVRCNLLRAWLFTSIVLPNWEGATALWEALAVGGWQPDAANLVKRFKHLMASKAQCAAMFLRFLDIPEEPHQLEVFDGARGVCWREELPGPR